MPYFIITFYNSVYYRYITPSLRTISLISDQSPKVLIICIFVIHLSFLLGVLLKRSRIHGPRSLDIRAILLAFSNFREIFYDADRP